MAALSDCRLPLLHECQNVVLDWHSSARCTLSLAGPFYAKVIDYSTMSL